MSNLLKNTITRSAVAALVLSAGIATTANAEVTRLSGADRYSTSDAIVKAGWSTGATTAVLASGLDANTVDALTVAPLAKKYNAPIILVNPKDSVETIVAKFTALNTKTVYIANGTGVISKKVDLGLKAAGIENVNRLGGSTRYETALNIAKEIGASNSIVVANGEDAHLVDSLSIAPIAAAKGMPIFLAGNSLDANTTDYIKSLGVKTTYVLGGTGVVSDATVKDLPEVTRLAGSGRYETNAKVVTSFKADLQLNFNNIFIASGEDRNLIDALAGAPLAASKGSPIIFAHDTINPDINILLKSIVTETTTITELGGIGAVTPAAEESIRRIQIGEVNTTVVTFPDKNLEQVIRDTIKKPTGDILKSDFEKITNLSATNKNITNLSGIENLINLTGLDLSENKISNIEALRELSKLSKLDLSKNEISNIEPLKSLSKLTALGLSENQISNIEALRGLSKLSKLDLFQNQISDIEPLRGLTDFTGLDLSENQISNIEPLKALTNLSVLGLSQNQISNIEALRGLTNLTVLDLSGNKVNNIETLSVLTKLAQLDLSENGINNIETLKALTNLTALNLFKNQISNIEALRGLTKLIVLYLSDNPIKDYSPVRSYYKNLQKKDFILI